MLKHKMVFSIISLLALGASAPRFGYSQTPKKGKLLYMTLTTGYHHDSVGLSKQVVKEIGDKSGAFETTVTEDVRAFTNENLRNFDAVMFNTTGELPMTEEEKTAFAGFVQSGHGFVGVHSVVDTFYAWRTFGEIIGAYFNGHPWHQLVTIDVADPQSKLVGFLGKSFQINDEIYQVSDFKAESSHVLLKLDTQSVDLKAPYVQVRYYGHPLAWTRKYGKGRVYINCLGHDDAVWNDPRYQEMLLNGIRWVLKQTN